MIPYPITFWKFQQKWEQELQVQLDNVQDVPYSGVVRDLRRCDIVFEILKLVDIDSTAVIPDSVVFGILFEQLGSLLQ